MVDSLPLFPLPSVLFPGVVLPLHVFEERYRVLVRRLLELPEGAQRRFGVVAIRPAGLAELAARDDAASSTDADDPPGEGESTGDTEPTDDSGSGGDRDSAQRSARALEALYPVGCTAELRQVDNREDGTYNIVTVGVERFALRGVDADREPYLVGEVDLLPAEPEPGPELGLLARRAGSVFEEYVAAVAAIGGSEVETIELPDEPDVLSYLVGAIALLTLEDRQSLLEQELTRDRLRREIRLLRRETALVRQLRVVPAPIPDIDGTPGRN